MIIFDIETDGLIQKLTKIHVIATYNTDTKEYKAFYNETLEDGVHYLNNQVVIGHNIIKFDIPVIQKFYPWFKPKAAIDTYVLSSLAYPDIKFTVDANLSTVVSGMYSLKAFGQRLGILKGTYGQQDNAWETLNEDMIKYCIQDVKVTKALWDKLKTKTISKDAITLEHNVSSIVGRLERYGFFFNIDKAMQLENNLRERSMELLEDLRNIFEPFTEITGYYKRDNKKRGIKAGDPKIKVSPFNPSSQLHIYKALVRKYPSKNFKWKVTPTGHPQVTIEFLKKISEEIPEAKKIVEYWNLKKRLSMMADGQGAWYKYYDSKTKRIYFSIRTQDTVSYRMAHNKPNLAQVPAEHEYRELFGVPKGKYLVGIDAKGLELRCLANRINDPDYTYEVLHGDIHTKNQQMAGLDTRQQAKRFIYAFLYGSGNTKLGEIKVGEGKKVSIVKLKEIGKQLKAKFYKELPSLKAFQDRLKEEARKTSFIKGLDGRMLHIRTDKNGRLQDYKAINLLLQSDGAIVMKRALVIADQDFQAAGLVPKVNYEFVNLVHDEWQIEVDTLEHAELIKELGNKAITKAGEYYNFNCKLEGDAKIGKTWADTH